MVDGIASSAISDSINFYFFFIATGNEWHVESCLSGEALRFKHGKTSFNTCILEVFSFIGIGQFLLLRNQTAWFKTKIPMVLWFKNLPFGIKYRFIQMNFTLLGRNLNGALMGENKLIFKTNIFFRICYRNIRSVIVNHHCEVCIQYI